MIKLFLRACSGRHLHFDEPVRLIVDNFEVLEDKILHLLLTPVLDLQLGEGVRLPGDLLLERLNVVLVNVIIAERVHKMSRFQPTDFGNDVHHYRIAGNVERDAETHVT